MASRYPPGQLSIKVKALLRLIPSLATPLLANTHKRTWTYMGVGDWAETRLWSPEKEEIRGRQWKGMASRAHRRRSRQTGSSPLWLPRPPPLTTSQPVPKHKTPHLVLSLLLGWRKPSWALSKADPFTSALPALSPQPSLPQVHPQLWLYWINPTDVNSNML